MTKRKQTAAQLAAPFKTYTRAEALRLAATLLAREARWLRTEQIIEASGHLQSYGVDYLRKLARDARKAK